MSEIQYLLLSKHDNVAVALNDIYLDDLEFSVSEFIPKGHKFSICEIPHGSSIIKAGHRIGIALGLSHQDPMFIFTT